MNEWLICLAMLQEVNNCHAPLELTPGKQLFQRAEPMQRYPHSDLMTPCNETANHKRARDQTCLHACISTAALTHREAERYHAPSHGRKRD